jgi:hypothetical protein
VARPSERFGFKETQSSGREMVERHMGQRDTSREREPSRERESVERDSGRQKDRQDTDDDREFLPRSHERDESDDDNADRDFHSNTQM